MAQRSDRLEAAKAIAARLKAGAAVTEPALEHQRTGTGGAELPKPTVADGGNQGAMYRGTASESGSTPAAVQQPLAISEADLAVRPWLGTPGTIGALDAAALKRSAGAESSKPTVSDGGTQSATYHGTASESGSIPAAVQQPLAISEATWRGLRASAAAAVAVVAARSQSPSPAAAAAA